MKTKTTILMTLFVAAALSVCAQTTVPTPQSVAPGYTPPQSMAQPSETQTTYTYQAPHAGTWDFYLMSGGWFFDNSTMTATNVLFERGGRNNPDIYADGRLRMDIDDAVFFGFGAGYNITEQLSVHAQFAYASPDYHATFEGHQVNEPDKPASGWVRGNADISTGDLALRYDLTQGRFRPFLQASIGYIYMDTGIRNGPYSYWRDWYWDDYYADTPTVRHTYITLGASAGANYYFTQNLFGQLSYTASWADAPHNWMLNQRVNVSVGWNY